MRETVTTTLFRILIEEHFDRHEQQPSPVEQAGYRKIAGQVERFWAQSHTLRKLDRGRQILFVNIPKLCKEHGIDGGLVTDAIEWFAVADIDPTKRFMSYLREVWNHHSTCREPLPSASMTGCLIPVAIGTTLAMFPIYLLCAMPGN